MTNKRKTKRISQSQKSVPKKQNPQTQQAVIKNIKTVSQNINDATLKKIVAKFLVKIAVFLSLFLFSEKRNTLRKKIIGIPYWWSGIILCSALFFLIKAYVLWHLGVVDRMSLGDTIWWYVARWGNDLLYCFLIWVLSITAMRIKKPLVMKSFFVLIGCLLLFIYAADLFALQNLHSRFMVWGISFFSWENAWPYMWSGILTIVLWFIGLNICVYAMYFARKVLVNKTWFLVVRLAILATVVFVGCSFFVPETSSYQQNILQLNLAIKNRWSVQWDKPYEAYFRSFATTNKRPNIIVVFAESFSSIDSSLAWWSRNLLPWFDTIASDGMFYSNFIANWCTSDAAHIAFFQWVEPWQTPKLDQTYSRYKSYTLWLPAFLHQQWYKTAFVSTISLDFLWQRDFLTSLQFDALIDNKDPYFLSSQKYVFRAAADDRLYEKTLSYLLEQKKTDPYTPQFIALQTISSHKPYDTPAWTTEVDAFKYADNALLQFYRNLEATNYFDNGILIVVWDHRKMQAMWYDEIDKRWEAAYWKTLLAVVGTWVEKWSVNNIPLQHLDLFSSLKRLTGSGGVLLHELYNDAFQKYQWRDAAIRYCQFVDKQYVASRDEKKSYTITPDQHSILASYIRSYYGFQQWRTYKEIFSDENTVWDIRTWKKSLFPNIVRIAHQWLHSKDPVNSLNAFYEAKAQGVEAVEMDVSFTRDGYPIVMHWPDIWRTRCVWEESLWKKNIAEFNLQLMKDSCKLYNWQVILTLQEVLEKTKWYFDRYFIDVKIETYEQRRHINAMLDSMQKLELTKNVVLSSIDEETNKILGKAKKLNVGWEVFDDHALTIALQAESKFIIMPYGLLTPERVTRIINANKIPVAYTVNKRDEVKKLYDQGVKFFITDEPQQITY